MQQLQETSVTEISWEPSAAGAHLSGLGPPLPPDGKVAEDSKKSCSIVQLPARLIQRARRANDQGRAGRRSGYGELDGHIVAKSKPHMDGSLRCALASVRLSPAHFHRHVEIRERDSFSSRERGMKRCVRARFPEGDALLACT
jgi:hypothetical protein